ncbi:carbon-nitrogen hydrolase [Terasakiispira papahanaumokuakeensis]|uniref:Carbon-nitrogen hydrolase n=1 Tax=Terasakiispira papahanaumokuakeensis TaxID=197479 RepID=A0A1E2V822_9GAMM|nr:nitrilase-related carbon-nitrogen hydrolase [Terasakiispira papahanaumokuakeensis]ODC03002.1 carbon-nitrogen hydrolase [Terasakiispira papahanaumokuakeensis]
MQLLLAQLSSQEGQIQKNLDRALEVIHSAAPETQLIIFPETHLTGFAEHGHTEDRALSLDSPQIQALIEVSQSTDTAVAIGLLEQRDHQVFNTTILITPEAGIQARYSKTHLWPDERPLVEAGTELVSTQWRGWQLGLLICYDIEFPEPARALAQMGTELLIVTNGNMDPYGPVHARAAQARAQDNQYFVAMTNRCGEGVGLRFAGESAVFAPSGETLQSAGHDDQLMTITLDRAALEEAKRDYHYLADRRLTLASPTLPSSRDPQTWPLNSPPNH